MTATDKTADVIIRELQEACGYSDGTDGEESGVDSLIDYKDALESAYAELLAKTEPDGTSITWSGEASDGFPDRIETIKGWYVKLTTLDRESIEASIVGSGVNVEIDGTTWNDAVTYLPVDDQGIAIEDAEAQTVRVFDVFIY